MARRPVIAGNWKMNKGVAEAVALLNDLLPQVKDIEDVEIVVCPTFTSLAAVSAAARGSNVGVGAQNVHWAESGAFTGEISAQMLGEIPVEYVIIGHSERRQYFGESDETVNARLKAALAAGLKPIVCVGELLEQRQTEQTEAVVGTQMAGAMAGLSAAEMAQVIIAYEPVWAIGTGLTASPEQAQAAHAFIRGEIRARYADVAEGVRILYGGSVKPGNAADLMGQPDLDGALVGGASLKTEDFCGIIRNSR